MLLAAACLGTPAGRVSTCAAEEYTQAPGASPEQIAAAIEKHIADGTRDGGGYYRLWHEGRELKLQLVRVHLEYLADLGGGVQFACVDLAGSDGPVYDVDFFLRGDPGHMSVTEAPTVHKVDGRPLYVWKQEQDDTWLRVSVDNAPPRLLGVVEDDDEFEFTYRMTVPALSGSAVLWLPLARSDDFQTVEVRDLRMPVEPRELTDGEHGNAVIYLSLGPEHGGSAIEIVYQVRRRAQSPYPASGPAPRQYLKPDRLVPDDPRFVAVADSVTRGRSTDLLRARALYDHVMEHVRYARYGPGWGHGDAIYACDVRTGNCSDFHSYFVALARAAGIPARFVVGAAIPSERNEGGIDGYHCWAEFFALGRWWPVDISEGDKNTVLAEYYFGHQPGNRLELSRGRDLHLDPGPASGPINFLAYPVLEVEGRSVEVRTEFTFRRLVESQ